MAAKTARVTRGARVAFTGALLAFTLLMLMLTFGLGPRSRLIPLTVAIPLTALLLYQLVRDVRAVDDRRAGGGQLQPRARGRDATGSAAGATARATDGAATERPLSEEPARVAHTAATIAWVALLPLLATLLGFVAGPALFVLLWARGRGGERTGVAVAAAALTGLLVYALFTWLLETPIPRGLLMEALWQ